MPVYHGKLLKLKAVKKSCKKFFLQVVLSFEEDLDIYLEIDEFTSENISAIIEVDKKYKYRLSFNNYFDTSRKQHISTLTRTYLEQSDNISFSCSEEYINMLSSIKNIENIDDLDKLSFISKNIETIYEKQEEQVLTQDIKNKVTFNKSPQLIIFSLSVLFIMFFGYLNQISSSEAKIHREALAESIQLSTEVATKQDEFLGLNDGRLDSDNIILEKVLLEESNVDSIELNQTITYHIPKGSVALTFDDGPSKYSTEIVDVLKKYDVGGTFFFVGRNVERYPDNVQYVHTNGYSIGSHSINHYNMPTLSYANQEIELIESIKLLEEITNSEINLFRPPYGAYSNNLMDLVIQNKYKMVLWNNDPKDWETRNADKIFDYIQNSDISGSIILLHESQAVVNALPKIIEYLQQLDLQIVNLQ